MHRYGASQTQACAVMRISRSVYGYRSRARDARPLLQRIKEIATTRVHYGYRRVHVLLRREGWKDNCKRVYRLSYRRAIATALPTPGQQIGALATAEAAGESDLTPEFSTSEE